MFKIPNQMYPKFTLATQYQVINLQVTHGDPVTRWFMKHFKESGVKQKQEGEMPGKIVKEDFL